LASLLHQRAKNQLSVSVINLFGSNSRTWEIDPLDKPLSGIDSDISMQYFGTSEEK